MKNLKLTLSESLTVKYALEDRIKKMIEFRKDYIEIKNDADFIKYALDEIKSCEDLLNLLK